MKFQGILLCTDLDGTLLADDSRISEQNRLAIEYFQREGGLFTFVTGRPPLAVRQLFLDIRPNALIGCLNGGGIYDGERDEVCDVSYLDSDADVMLDAVERAMPDVGIMVVNRSGVFFTNEVTANERYSQNRCLPFPNRPRSDVECPYYKVVFLHHEEARLDEVAALLREHPLADRFSYIRSEREIYEILPKGASKGNVMLRIADRLGIDRTHTIAVGDYNNDVSMIRAAGVGYAVANAAPAARAAADRITVSNNESAIAAIIRDLDEGNISFPEK